MIGIRFQIAVWRTKWTNESEQVREESDTKASSGDPSLRLKPYREGASLGPMCLPTGVVPIWFEILHSWTIEWIMEQELQPRQQVNLCMSVYFYSCNFASI